MHLALKACHVIVRYILLQLLLPDPTYMGQSFVCHMNPWRAIIFQSGWRMCLCNNQMYINYSSSWMIYLHLLSMDRYPWIVIDLSSCQAGSCAYATTIYATVPIMNKRYNAFIIALSQNTNYYIVNSRAPIFYIHSMYSQPIQHV